MGQLRWLLFGPVLAIGIAYYLSYQRRPQLGAIVTTKSGKVQGIISRSRDGREFEQWLGIPYAQPPVGVLRFSSPQPFLAWDGVRDGSRHGSRCAQHQMFLSANPVDEDCLFLNIHAPKLDRQQKLPVMVNIHGGLFYAMGADDYLPHYFMDQNVILVTVNYRLGLFGFISTADTNVRGNMGLHDQVLALKWVKDNIEQFGGDPDTITIFGHSAGGVSVHLHMLNHKNSGLFSKAISQSGTGVSVWSIERAEESRGRALQIAKSAGCLRMSVEATVDCLRSLQWMAILEAEMEFLGHFEFNEITRDEHPFLPVIEAVEDEGAFITEHPLNLISRGAMLKVPWMTGVTANEALFGVYAFQDEPERMEKIDVNWSSKVRRMLGLERQNDTVVQDLARRLRRFYFPPGDASVHTSEKVDRYKDLISDLYLNFQLYTVAHIQKKFAPVHLYLYNQTEGISGGAILAATDSKLTFPLGFYWALIKEYFRLRVFACFTKEGGVSHGDDQMVLFPISNWISVNTADVDYQFSKDIVKLWVDFASKQPSKVAFRGVKLPEQDANAGVLNYLELSDMPKIIPQPFEERMKFLESLDYLKFCSKPD